MAKYQKLTINNVIGGHVADRIEDEIARVHQAMKDPKTGLEPSGEVTVKIKLKGRRENQVLDPFLDISAHVSAKYPGYTTSGKIVEEDGVLKTNVTSNDVKQFGMFVMNDRVADEDAKPSSKN